MCGRYALFSSPFKLGEKLPLSSPPPQRDPRYNISPGIEIVGIYYSEADEQPAFGQLWWGYRPHWDGATAPEPINAKTETRESNRYFRGAFHHSPLPDPG